MYTMSPEELANLEDIHYLPKDQQPNISEDIKTIAIVIVTCGMMFFGCLMFMAIATRKSICGGTDK